MKLTWANRITIGRVLLIVPFVICMLKINDPTLSEPVQDGLRYAALVMFLLMAVSDALDGYMARSRGQTTKLGAFLDPMADKLLMACAAVLLASERSAVGEFVLPITVVVLIVGKDAFLLLGFLIVYFITFEVRIFPAWIGKIATVLQLSMVTGVLIGPEVSAVFPGWIWVLRMLWWSAAGTAIMATFIYVREGSKIVEEHERNHNVIA